MRVFRGQAAGGLLHTLDFVGEGSDAFAEPGGELRELIDERETFVVRRGGAQSDGQHGEQDDERCGEGAWNVPAL